MLWPAVVSPMSGFAAHLLLFPLSYEHLPAQPLRTKRFHQHRFHDDICYHAAGAQAVACAAGTVQQIG